MRPERVHRSASNKTSHNQVITVFTWAMFITRDTVTSFSAASWTFKRSGFFFCYSLEDEVIIFSSHHIQSHHHHHQPAQYKDVDWRDTAGPALFKCKNSAKYKTQSGLPKVKLSAMSLCYLCFKHNHQLFWSVKSEDVIDSLTMDQVSEQLLFCCSVDVCGGAADLGIVTL